MKQIESISNLIYVYITLLHGLEACPLGSSDNNSLFTSVFMGSSILSDEFMCSSYYQY